MADEKPYRLELDQMELQFLMWACQQAAEPGQNSYQSLVAIEARLRKMLGGQGEETPEGGADPAQSLAPQQEVVAAPKLAAGWSSGLFGDYSHWFPEADDTSGYVGGRYCRAWGRTSLCGMVRRHRGQGRPRPSGKPACSRCLAALEKREGRK